MADDQHDDLRVELLHAGPPPVLAVAGELDLASTGAWTERMRRLLGEAAPPAGLVLDLSGVAFIDSSALSVLVRLHEQVLEAGGRLVVRNPSRPVRRLFEIVGMDRLLAVEDGAAS